ncbi:predicted protein [Histoplasma mississippiense (nom. inval.)]|uniref:predicted protein n=1 Tax=Ajellomyces capsulatus (strain NAm1 / WU24) TaxID=2059318 RepID=UPI000157B399|nr:predicted protein [Histoplasma mississippiense (nom. inval.)]EDN02503.1 predicted protein [Histoplasma mississippiense (nom. inval.)]
MSASPNGAARWASDQAFALLQSFFFFQYSLPTLDGTPGNDGWAVGRHGAGYTANFKYRDRGDENASQREVFVQIAPYGLGGGQGEEEGGAVPSYIGEGVEFGCYSGTVTARFAPDGYSTAFAFGTASPEVRTEGCVQADKL